MLQMFMKVTSNSEQAAENTKYSQRQKKTSFQKNR